MQKPFSASRKKLTIMTKTEIRREMKALNKAMQPGERRCAADNIIAQTERLEAFKNAHTVALFCSLPDEPPTEEMIARWCRTKNIVLPRVEGDTMQFYPYDPAGMNKGAFGITEPTGETPTEPAQIDLIIVPGVAFTASGERLGRGKGYYDKYLSSPGFNATKVGICYAHQLRPELPCEPHDMKMDCVIAG